MFRKFFESLILNVGIRGFSAPHKTEGDLVNVKLKEPFSNPLST